MDRESGSFLMTRVSVRRNGNARGSKASMKSLTSTFSSPDSDTFFFLQLRKSTNTTGIKRTRLIINVPGKLKMNIECNPFRVCAKEIGFDESKYFFRFV